jgi:glycerol-3-phosphate acyltransferase PlsY
MMILGLAILGYALGSIPVAWLLTKGITGQDLRELGSGNVGVMNTALSAARWAGLLVFLTEGLKGALAVLIPRALGAGDIAIGVTVLAAVIGTRWPIWLRFAGGRGNTTGGAALILISWQGAAACLMLWFLARLLLHSSFKATRLMLVLLPLLIGGATQSWLYALCGLALGLIYLNAQSRESDDHLMLKEHWPSLWVFLTSPRRERNAG